MRGERRIWLIVLAVLFVTAAAGAAEVGTITFVDGYPELERDGRTSYEQIDFGFRVENFDTYRTDAISSLEIDFDPATGITGTLTVEPDTVFYIELTRIQGERVAAIELLAGTLSARVDALTGISGFQVRSATTAAGVRGTDFTVTTAVGGEILVAADEGLVEVTLDDRDTRYASPGEAVEVAEDQGLITNIRYSRPGAEFRAEWRSEREERFLEIAPTVLRFYGLQYRRARDAFIDAYTSLMEQRETIDAWIQEDERSVTLRPGAVAARVNSARRVVGDIVRIRLAQRRFESLFVRLDRMRPVLAGQARDIEISDGYSAADLFQEIARDRRVMYERLATVRYISKLFEERNTDQQ